MAVTTLVDYMISMHPARIVRVVESQDHDDKNGWMVTCPCYNDSGVFAGSSGPFYFNLDDAKTRLRSHMMATVHHLFDVVHCANGDYVAVLRK